MTAHVATHQMFVSGEWIPVASGKIFKPEKPATGETIALIAEGEAGDIDHAVDDASGKRYS